MDNTQIPPVATAMRRRLINVDALIEYLSKPEGAPATGKIRRIEA